MHPLGLGARPPSPVRFGPVRPMNRRKTALARSDRPPPGGTSADRTRIWPALIAGGSMQGPFLRGALLRRLGSAAQHPNLLAFSGEEMSGSSATTRRPATNTEMLPEQAIGGDGPVCHARIASLQSRHHLGPGLGSCLQRVLRLERCRQVLGQVHSFPTGARAARECAAGGAPPRSTVAPRQPVRKRRPSWCRSRDPAGRCGRR